ncbi:MAG TPA: tetratricopeptide repeat protein [Patescibacteria group bacterium]|nr:tetratricopeptide repeat protein [Patescibacteria group bacterium]
MKKPAKQSPRNYRSITEGFGKFKKKQSKLLQKLKIESLVFLYVLTVILILIFSFDLFQNFQKQKEIGFQGEKIQSEIRLWQDIADKFKGYKEAYYKLALLEYQLGELDKAKYYVDKSLFLDPNFGKAIELKKILYNY